MPEAQLYTKQNKLCKEIKLEIYIFKQRVVNKNRLRQNVIMYFRIVKLCHTISKNIAHSFLSSADFFSKSTFKKKIFQEYH